MTGAESYGNDGYPSEAAEGDPMVPRTNRAIAIFHVRARYDGSHSTSTYSEFTDIYVIWVRWFDLDKTAPGGFGTRRLHRISFISDADQEAFPFGFLGDGFLGVGFGLLDV